MSIDNLEDISDVLKVFNLSAMAELRKFPHPWGESHTFLASDDTSRIVLRRWRGQERIGRMKVEARFLNKLIASGFNECASLIHTQDERLWAVDDAGVGWTAYEYLEGKTLESMDMRSAEIVGTLMARFHKAASKIMPEISMPWNGRRPLIESMHQMLEEGGFLSQIDNLKMAIFLKRNILPKLDDYCSLPRSFIHGDLMLDNIIVSGGSGRLIDFEFVKEGPRVSDFASAFAPIRDENGNFIIAKRDYVENVIDAYNQEADIPLGQDELKFLWVGAVIRSCLIYEGMHKQSSPYQSASLRNLCAMIEMNNY